MQTQSRRSPGSPRPRSSDTSGCLKRSPRRRPFRFRRRRCLNERTPETTTAEDAMDTSDNQLTTSAIRTGSDVLNTPDPRRWWALALLCGGFSEHGLQWVLSAYALTYGGLLLLGGRAADLLGRRRLFMTGVLLLTAASLVCGLARASSPPSWPASCWPESARRWRSCSQAARGQRRSTNERRTKNGKGRHQRQRLARRSDPRPGR